MQNNSHTQASIATPHSSSNNKMCLGISSKFFQSFMAPKQAKEIPKTPVVNSNKIMTPSSRIKILKPLVANHRYSTSNQFVNEKTAEDEYYTLTRDTNESQRVSQRDPLKEQCASSFDNRKSSAHQYKINSQNNDNDGMSVNRLNSDESQNYGIPQKSTISGQGRHYSQSHHNRGLSQASETNSILDQVDRNFLSKPEVNSVYGSSLISNYQDTEQTRLNQKNDKQMARNCAKIKILKPSQIVKKSDEAASSFRSSFAFEKSRKQSCPSINNQSNKNEHDSTENNFLVSFSEQTGTTMNNTPIITQLTQETTHNADGDKLSKIHRSTKSKSRRDLKINSETATINSCTQSCTALPARVSNKSNNDLSFVPSQQNESIQNPTKFDLTLKHQHSENYNNNNILLHKIATIGNKVSERKLEGPLIARKSSKHSYKNSYQESNHIKRHISDINLPVRVVQTEISEDSQDSYTQPNKGPNSVRQTAIDFQQTMRIINNAQQYQGYPISTKKCLIESKRVENQGAQQPSTSEYFSTKTFHTKNKSLFNGTTLRQSTNSLVSEFNSTNSINLEDKAISNNDTESVKSSQQANAKKAFNYYKSHIIESHNNQQKEEPLDGKRGQSQDKKTSANIINNQDFQGLLQNANDLIKMIKTQEKQIDKIIDKISQKTKAELSLTQAEKDVRNLTKAFKVFIQANSISSRSQLDTIKALLQQHVRTHYLVFGLIRIFRDDIKTNQDLSNLILQALKQVRENFRPFITMIRAICQNPLTYKQKRKQSYDFDKIQSIRKGQLIDQREVTENDLQEPINEQIQIIKQNIQSALQFIKKICRQAEQNQDRYKQLLRIINHIEQGGQNKSNGNSLRLKSQTKKVLRALKNEQLPQPAQEKAPQDQKRKRNIFSTVESTITPKSQVLNSDIDVVKRGNSTKDLPQYDKENCNPNLPTQRKYSMIKENSSKGILSDTALVSSQQKSLVAKRCSTSGSIMTEQQNKNMLERTRTQGKPESMVMNKIVQPISQIKSSLQRSCSVPQKDIRLPSKLPNNIKYTLVLDLDETLVHYDPQINNYRVRPYAHKFIQQMSKYYELVIFTAGIKDYADWILDDFDKAGYISHRLYRDSTMHKNGIHIKDVSRLGRDLSKTIIIDNIEENFQGQPNNGIPIKSWYIDPLDKELEKLTQFLKEIAINNTDDVRTEIIKFKLSGEYCKSGSAGSNRPKRDYTRIR